ncbi:subtilisin-like protein [Ascobolus immersus RN42]|uniref:Subtilisin-like protein n=1 Tax=Ascobolus immersus RN42 TaxID=1160509 RepID=A0A3N4IPB6_ASCIM|nr:subtilisin-like protein [Ascobolus immersus RN42]
MSETAIYVVLYDENRHITPGDYEEKAVIARRTVERHGGQIFSDLYVPSMRAYGYVLFGTDITFDHLKRTNNLLCVCKDRDLPTDIIVKNRTESYALRRISINGAKKRNFVYDTEESGQGILVYVLDISADKDHQELAGRLIHGPNFSHRRTPEIPVQPPHPNHSHGTMVASLVAGSTVGVAKRAKMISVPIASRIEDQYVSLAGAAEAIYWVARDAHRRGLLSPRLRAVVTLCFEGLPLLANDGSQPMIGNVLGECVEAASRAGLVFVASAGNLGLNLNITPEAPQSVASCITVGSINEQDKVSSFSNFGTCVDVMAPGDQVRCAVPGGGYSYERGTSMAGALVAGIVACILSGGDYQNVAQVKAELLRRARPGAYSRHEEIMRINTSLIASLGTSTDVQ